MQPDQPAPAAPVPMNKRTKIALWLMIAPTAVLVLNFLLFAVVNYLFRGAPSADGLFASQDAIQTISNVFLFVLGLAAFLAWLPGLIIGIVLLATKK